MTYVYLIQMMDDDICKIGVSRSPSKRLAFIQTGMPYKLRLAGKWDLAEPYSVERLAHEALKGKNLNGEWFRATEAEACLAIKAGIQQVMDGRRVKRNLAVFQGSGANASRKKRRAAADAKAEPARPYWHLPSSEWPGWKLCEMTGLSYNTLIDRFGGREKAQARYQRNLKRKQQREQA